MTTKKKPELFGDGYRGCLMSSVAGFNQKEDGHLDIHLKSGDVVHLQFGNDYLADLAKEKLESYFTVTNMESNPCNVCSRSDIVDTSYEQKDRKRTYCYHCQGYDEFRKPGTDPHDETT